MADTLDIDRTKDSGAGWVAEHVRRYLETDGAEGHEWNGVPTLVLVTTGRRSGQPRRTALIYGRDGDDFGEGADLAGLRGVRDDDRPGDSGGHPAADLSRLSRSFGGGLGGVGGVVAGNRPDGVLPDRADLELPEPAAAHRDGTHRHRPVLPVPW